MDQIQADAVREFARECAEEEVARAVLSAFCRAAEKETGDYWEIQRMEDGDLAVVQTFRAANDAMDDPEVSDETKKLMVTGMIYCTSSGSLAGLADRLVKSFRRDPPAPGALRETSWPLPFLDGCSSVEEMSIKLAAYC